MTTQEPNWPDYQNLADSPAWEMQFDVSARSGSDNRWRWRRRVATGEQLPDWTYGADLLIPELTPDR